MGRQRLPVIVGFGGINAAGRASGHHAYSRLVYSALAQDQQGEWLVMLPSEWLLNLLKERNPDFDFQAEPFERASLAT